MQALVQVRRWLITLLAALAMLAVIGFAIANPGAIAIAAPLAVAFALLLMGRRLESVRLILAADVLAVVAVLFLALQHLRH